MFVLLVKNKVFVLEMLIFDGNVRNEFELFSCKTKIISQT